MAPPVRKKSTPKKGASKTSPSKRADSETARRIRGATAGKKSKKKK